MKASLFALAVTVFFTAKAMSYDVNCSPLKTPVKYRFEKNDHLAAVLRKFKLEPVFGRNKFLDQTLKLNNLKNADSISLGDALFLPLPCEQEAQKWVLKNSESNDFRWINAQAAGKTSESHPTAGTTASEIKAALDQPNQASLKMQTVATAMAATAAMTKVVSEDNKNSTVQSIAEENPEMDSRLKEIISPPQKTTSPESVQAQLDDLEKKKKDPNQKNEISDALRYRMICDGEWDGDQCIPRNSILYTSLAGWFNRYDGTDPSVSVNNEGVLLSRFNPELTLGWSHYWTKSIRSRFQASFKKISMLPEAREVPIEQDEKVLTDFLSEIRFETGIWGFGIGFKQFDKLFYRFRFSGLSTPCIGGSAGFTGCGIFIHAANVSMFYTNASWLFYQAGKFSSDLLFTVGYLGASNTSGWTIDPGTAWSLEFRVQHDRIQEYLFGSISYGQQSQNTSIEIQKATELGLSIGYAWKLKDW